MTEDLPEGYEICLRQTFGRVIITKNIKRKLYLLRLTIS